MCLGSRQVRLSKCGSVPDKGLRPQVSARSVRHGVDGAVVENAEMWALCLCRQRRLPAPSPCQFPCRLAPWGAAPRRAVATSSRGTDCPKASVHCRPVPPASHAASRHGGVGMGWGWGVCWGWGRLGPASATRSLPGSKDMVPAFWPWLL